MSLLEEYRKQFLWRDWDTALSTCPIQPGQHVLDLGCAVGDLSRELAQRGAIVTGVDGNAELLQFAREQNYSNCTFVQQDLSSLRLNQKFSGLWCSFTAAYFTNFAGIFDRWLTLLEDDAWACVTEIDDLLGHEPISKTTRRRIIQFYEQALISERYDFLSGRKIGDTITARKFKVGKIELRDQELSFNGPASELILKAWSKRFDRMGLLKAFWGQEFNEFKDEFLNTLASPRHRSLCKVLCYTCCPHDTSNIPAGQKIQPIQEVSKRT